jgi:hypothetical protein
MASNDLARIKRNVAKMAAQNAPVEDIDGYIASEGVTVDDVRNFKPTGVGEDMLRSGAAGVRQGIEALPGGAGDARELAKAGSNYLFGENFTKAAGDFITNNVPAGKLLSIAPTTADIHGATSKVIGESYEPQTTAGEYARTTGQFAPSLMSPGSLTKRVAQTVIPAVASETAGQVTKGTAAEPYARFLGALTGGVATAKNARPKVAPGPVAADLAKEANAIFNQVKQSGVTASPRALNTLYSTVGTKLRDFGFHPKLQPDTAVVVQELAKVRGTPLSLPELHNMRKLATGAARTAQKADDRAASGRIVEAIDDIIADAGNFSAGSDQARNLLRQGIETSKRKIKTEMIEDIVDRAQNQATGFENGLVVQFRQLANNKKKMRSFSPAEQGMIRSIVRRPTAHGMLRALGMLSPTSTFGGITTGMGIMSGVIPGLASAGIGAAAKAGAGKLTRGKVDRLQTAVSTGKAAPKRRPLLSFNPEELARLLLSGEGGRISAGKVPVE